MPKFNANQQIYIETVHEGESHYYENQIVKVGELHGKLMVKNCFVTIACMRFTGDIDSENSSLVVGMREGGLHNFTLRDSKIAKLDHDIHLYVGKSTLLGKSLGSQTLYGSAVGREDTYACISSIRIFTADSPMRNFALKRVDAIQTLRNYCQSWFSQNGDQTAVYEYLNQAPALIDGYCLMQKINLDQKRLLLSHMRRRITLDYKDFPHHDIKLELPGLEGSTPIEVKNDRCTQDGRTIEMLSIGPLVFKQLDLLPDASFRIYDQPICGHEGTLRTTVAELIDEANEYVVVKQPLRA